MNPRHLRPGLHVVVPVGDLDMPVCCYGVVAGPADETGVWWVNVDHGTGALMAQQYRAEEIFGIPAVNLHRTETP